MSERIIRIKRACSVKRLLLIFVQSILLTTNALADVWCTTDDGLKYTIDLANIAATLTNNSDNAYTGDIVIPAKVTYNGKNYPVKALSEKCFYQSTITSVSIPNSVEEIGNYCFSGCASLEAIDFPSSVKTLGDYCFQNCSSLASISLPNTITKLGKYCFQNCKKITSMKVPSSITDLPDGCFQWSDLSEGVTLPDNLLKVGNYCFAKCKFSEIEVPASVTEVGEDAFSENSNLKKAIFLGSNTKIGKSAFWECTSLADIKLPAALETIENGCFYKAAFAKISIPKTVKNIARCAFWECSNLKELVIPSLVESIQPLTFTACTSLETITIGSGVTSIYQKTSTHDMMGSSSFSGCTNLKIINCYAVVPPTIYNADSNFFPSIYDQCILNVPEEAVEAYKKADYWKNFTHIGILSDPEPGTEEEQITENYVDGKSEIIPEGTYFAGKLTYTRTGNVIVKGNYVAQCLPFDINLAETTCFSEVYIPMDIALYNTNSKLLTMMLDNADMTSVIKAGQPFVAKLAEDKVELKNCNTTYISSNYQTKVIETPFKVYNTNGESGVLHRNNDLDVRFGGSYQKMDNLDGNVYKTFASDGRFYEAERVKPFRAYVYKANAAAQAMVQSITWGLGDETTGIKFIETPEQTAKSNKVFTLDGKLVNQTGDTKSLKKGVYIVNGRKIFIK